MKLELGLVGHVAVPADDRSQRSREADRLGRPGGRGVSDPQLY